MSTTTAVARGLTSTTAPGKVFESRGDLAQHYKSDWHRYNLKRREAGLPLLTEPEFIARLEAALALRREQQDERNGKDHLKNKESKKKRKQGKKAGGASIKSAVPAYDKMKEQAATESDVQAEAEDGESVVDDETNTEEDSKAPEPEEPPEINPLQSIFDNHVSETLEENVEYMQKKFGFFIPDQEYLVDLEGFLGYCQEKVKLGHHCLYCQKVFTTWYGCQNHMICLRHSKIKYERGIDMEEFDPFYDFTEADEEFLGRKLTKLKLASEADDDDDNDDNDDEDGWEDISDDEDVPEADVTDDDDEDDDGLYAAYEDELAKFGFDVTALGELVFPDGRIIGHRGLNRYYKQRYRAENNSTAVVAAKNAAGERLYRGRVYNVGPAAGEENPSSALALARAGGAGSVAQGRAGNGVLVKSASGGFTAVSLYRYRAVVKKARRDEARGHRQQLRTTRNINRMDKKANRLMNGVSVAHAAR